MARFLSAGLLLVAATLAASCSDGNGTASDGVAGPAELRGETIGIASTSGPAVLELRYVLQQKYGLEAGLGADADVIVVESSADSLLTQLRGGEVGAALLSQLGAFEALKDGRIRVLVPISEAMRDLTGVPVANSVLVSYPDDVEQKPGILAELNRLLEASVAYFDANREEVIDAVAATQSVDAEFLRWWWQQYDLPLGELSPDIQQSILAFWQAAVTLGDIDAYPELSEVLFVGTDGSARLVPHGVRETVSLAVLDDPSRHAALYALEQGLVTSNIVDVSITYHPMSALNEATSTRQYDVVEAPPLAVPLAKQSGIDLVIVSAGVFELGGTVLVVYD